MSTIRHQDRTSIFSAADQEMDRVETMRLIARARQERAEVTGALLRQAGAAISRWLVMPVVAWYQREQLRLQLSGMDDRLLADVGLTRGDIPRVVRNAHEFSVAVTETPASSATLHHLPTGRKSATPAVAATDEHPLAA